MTPVQSDPASPDSAPTNGHVSSPSARIARWWLSRGVYTIPLPPESKKPRDFGDFIAKDWEQFRLQEADIDRLFPPNCNAGIVLGSPSRGCVDVDLDCPEAIAVAPILLPPTGLTWGRPSTESHWNYSCDDPPVKTFQFFDPCRNPEDGRITLVELRSDGGQTICPPSIYPIEPEKGHLTTEPCVWHRRGEPGRAIGHELLDGVREVAAASLLARYSPLGSRHFTAVALGGALLRGGWTLERVETFVRAVAIAAKHTDIADRIKAVRDSAKNLEADEKTTGLPRLAELLGARGQVIVEKLREWLKLRPVEKTTAHIGSGSSASNPSSPPRYIPLPEYTAFPVECLPPPWNAYAREGAQALRCDAAFIALPLMAVLAGAIGNTRRLLVSGVWYEPSVLWTCTVGESGTRKSPGSELATAPVSAIQKRFQKEYKNAIKAFIRDMKELAEKGGDGGEEEPEKPKLKRVLVSDITIEKLVSLLDDNPRGMLVYRDELAGWVNSFTRYKSGSSDESHWLSVHRAGQIIYDRKTGNKLTVMLPSAAVSVTGGIQPGTLARLMTPAFFESGLVARVIFAMPPRTPKTWSEDTISEETEKACKASIETLFDLASDVDDEGDPRPRIVSLSPEAKQRFALFVNEWGVLQYQAEAEMAAAYSKLESFAARFALIHHCVLKSQCLEDTDPVGLESVEAGIKLAHWCANETDRVYRMLGEPPEERKIRKLVEHVQRLVGKNHAGRVTARLLQQNNNRAYRTVAEARNALNSLAALKLGKWIKEPILNGNQNEFFVLTLPEPEKDETEATVPTSPPPPADVPPSSPPSEPETGNRDDITVSSDDPADETSALIVEDSSTDPGPTAGYRLITTPEGLSDAVTAVEMGGAIGLDTETTGLSHAQDRVRLIQLSTACGTFLIDVFAFSDPVSAFDDLFLALNKTGIIGHNLHFDLPFLMRLGFTPGRMLDTMLASRILQAGDITADNSLKAVAKKYLNLELDKENRKADWSGPLSPEMLQYAALDAEVPVKLREPLEAELEAAKLQKVWQIENATLPCVAWASRNGVAFDRPAWGRLAREAEEARERLDDQLNEIAPGEATLIGKARRNWNSTDQVKEAFQLCGITLESTDDNALAKIDHPLAALMRDFRSTTKLTGTYGNAWLKHVAPDGRVYSSWNQIGAGASGRMSNSKPNLQQVPRDVRYRKCFAAPPGRVLVRADYSQIELRIAAKLTGDQRMLHAFCNGEDIHTMTAAALTGKSIAEVTKPERQLAKAINFGLLYGQGAKSLVVYVKSDYGITLTLEEATAHRETFFKTYPGLRKWHRQIGFNKNPIETRTLKPAFRRRLAVGRFTEKANTPVQGTGADGLKFALALLWQRRSMCPGAFPVLFVHDEIVVECGADQTAQVMDWLKGAMMDGMEPIIKPVPVVVDCSIGQTWGDK